jgi:hypothetical protein
VGEERGLFEDDMGGGEGGTERADHLSGVCGLHGS